MLEGVNGGPKVSNSGEIKLFTCQSPELKPRGHVEDRCGGVPHGESASACAGEGENAADPDL